jgi:probable rRNA maturation factor
MARPAARQKGVALSVAVLEVDVVVECQDWETVPGLEGAIVQAARHAFLAGSAPPSKEVRTTVALLSDAEVRALNAQFRGKDKATNVLSFPPGSLAGPVLGAVKDLGDIALAYETMVGEARESGIALLDHVRHLVVHGILHLLGYDHETETEAERMEALETRVLAGLGVADPYAR